MFMKLLKQLAEFNRLVEEQKEEIQNLQESRNSWEDKYLNASQKLVESDQRAENLQQSVNTLGKTLERVTKENEHLKALLVSEWNV